MDTSYRCDTYTSTLYLKSMNMTEIAEVFESLHQAVGKPSMLGWVKAYIKLVKSLPPTEILCN